MNIKDYALIGDAGSAALVSKNGSIDWCCMPDFDSPAIFSALLDERQGGFFSIKPQSTFDSRQEYISDTNVLQTNFTSANGKFCLTDAFVAEEEERKKETLFAAHEILRLVEGISGEVLVRLQFQPKIFYGKKNVRLKAQNNFGFHFHWKEHIFFFQSTLSYDGFYFNREEGHLSIDFNLKAGEKVLFSLSYSSQNPAIVPELKITGLSRLKETIRYWENWMDNCTYSGIFEREVKRSVLALKLLTYGASGAIVAAPTTSLPESPGGSRNWDYRYCWLRDASFTVRALLSLGFQKEVEAYMNWILHATQLTRPKVQIVYSIYGEPKLKEKELKWLHGYQNSLPVRIGNGAYGQFQLDVYGEVLDAFYSFSSIVDSFDKRSIAFILSLAETICKIWRLPDNGIWEGRTEEFHHTHSKLMAWVGLDRAILLSEKYGWKNAPLPQFRKEALLIREEIEKIGFNASLNAYTQKFHGKDLDASLLCMPLVNYCAVLDPRMRSTKTLIEKELSQNKLFFRYKSKDGLNGKEASFGICTFWYIENLAKAGEIEKAIDYFQNIISKASPTGLLSEEIDAESDALLGNYPQGFSHIGLINAALSIDESIKNQNKRS